MLNIRDTLNQLLRRQDLSRNQAHELFETIMRGELPDVVLSAILTAIAAKGESVDELVAAASAMRARSITVSAPPGAIDTCGTGGDGISTFNTSTTAAIIAAAAGAVVAKHGNRSSTRASGSTEVLTHLGIDVDAPVEMVERSLRELNIGYLNARNLHPAMKHAAAVRQALPMRTIFNLLGPLTNPAGAKRQLLGVPRRELVRLIAGALHALRTEHAWVVHGSDGLCDLTITGPSFVAEVTRDGIREFTINPSDADLTVGPLTALKVESPEHSAQVVMSLLRGATGSACDHALLNAGAVLLIAEKATSLHEGVILARKAITNGSAARLLDRWKEIAGIHRDSNPKPDTSI